MVLNSYIRRYAIILASAVILLNASQQVNAQQKAPHLSFIVSIKDAAAHKLQVAFRVDGLKKGAIDFKMPAWTPGYYQLMNYANNVENFSAVDAGGKNLQWTKSSTNGWEVKTGNTSTIIISYAVKADRSFVASNYVDETRAYISPAGVFLHPAGHIGQEVTIQFEPLAGWNMIATGLDTVKGQSNTFYAENYDILYDSPVLMGALERLPSFTVNGIPHHFIAFKPGEFDRTQFMEDLKKIVTTASGIIGDIPYKHYTFIGIGPGRGGIEHLNSTAIAFNGSGLNDRDSRNGMYNFLAHEYFHHFNVKRIRPIELGPFDYDKGSRTKMLWLSEGLTVYYEYLVVKRAGLMTTDELLKTIQSSIKAYETKPGRKFQTPAEASYNTWEEGPFGRTGDEVNKTISPYDKGTALGLLLDFKIRHETGNEKSLDHLMRLLYNKYYKEMGRGFTEKEFREEAEKLAGVSLPDFFDYIYTLKQVDYPTYFGYAGLAIETTAYEMPDPWLGLSVRDQRDTLWVSNVDWLSPAWNAGIRARYAVLEVNGNKMNAATFNELMATKKEGDILNMVFSAAGTKKTVDITLGKKYEKNFTISRIPNPSALQQQILKSWWGEK